MNNLVIPAAGASSRFPNMKLKWLLTHPTGGMVIEKVLEPFDLSCYDRVIITALKEHADKYSIATVLQQVFGDKVELCVLEQKTSSAVETIQQTIDSMSLQGHITIKDSDGVIESSFPISKNYVCGCKVSDFDIREVHNKSFIVHNENNTVLDIQEKNVVSDVVCLGVYSMSIDDFKYAYESIKTSLAYRYENEMYVSHIVSYLVESGVVFECQYVNDFKDWGTLEVWREEQERYKTFFLDIDGVFLYNTGPYGEKNWYNTLEPIVENVNLLKDLSDAGHQLIFTTSRSKDALGPFVEMLNNNNIRYKEIISECFHSQRIIINDFAPTNPYPSCRSVSIPRNSLLKEYMK